MAKAVQKAQEKPQASKAIALLKDAVLVDSALARFIKQGDLTGFSEEQKAVVYLKMCERANIDPFTHPFDVIYIPSSGKTILYANQQFTTQLGEMHKTSVEDVHREIVKDVYLTHITMTDREGRRGYDVGAGALAGKGGDNLGNAIKKSNTQAQRRCILKMYGFGMLDKSELMDIPGGVERQKLDLSKFLLTSPQAKRGEKK